jgi:signal transduction histidine kinase
MLARLERAFQDQRNFLLDVSHDLRTPLAALRGNIDVLLMRGDLDEDTRAQLEHMSAETGRLIRLTTNLLYMASADSGRQAERRPVELDVVCLEVYRQVKDLRTDVGVRLGQEDQLTVIGDRDLLKQMVLNLAENAVKYSPREGKVTLSLYRSNGSARITIEDNGPGIPADQLPHIFERFYRGNNRGKTGGSGLGLAIASWVAQAHGGNIDVESEPGRGSTFSVVLPLSTGSGS